MNNDKDKNNNIRLLKVNNKSSIEDEKSLVTYRVRFNDGSEETIKRAGFQLFPGVNAFFTTLEADEENFILKDGFSFSSVKSITVVED